MGLFDFFGRKREDEAKEAELRKEEAEKDSAAAQKEAHPGFRIPEIRPINGMKAGGEDAPCGEESIGRERKEELCGLIWESRLKYETVRELTTQELLFLMTAMEKAQIEKPLENYEENHQIIYSEILNRVRSAEKLSVLYDLTTGYPFLESGLCCVYLEQDRAKLAAEMYAKQFRKLDAVEVPLYTDMPDGRKKSFFDYLGYLGATWLLLDNGWYRARFKAGDVVNSIQWEETPQKEVKNPKLFFAGLNLTQEMRWTVDYEKRKEILGRRQFEAYTALRMSRLLVPVITPEGTAPDEHGKYTLKEGEQLRIPLAKDGQGNEFVPVFTDSPEFSRAFGKKPEIRPAIVEYSKLIPTMTGKKGLIVNPAGLKLAFALQDLAGMEKVLAAAAKKAEEKKAEEKAEEKTEKKTGDI